MSELESIDPAVLLDPVDMPYAAYPCKLGAILILPDARDDSRRTNRYLATRTRTDVGSLSFASKPLTTLELRLARSRPWAIWKARRITIETVNESIYDHPKYYDLVFGADCAAEVKFIRACGEAYGCGKSDVGQARMFEPACGTGRLLFALARKGYAVAGFDLNEKAVAFCNARFRRHGIR